MKKISYLIIVFTLSIVACKNEKKETKIAENEVVKTEVITPKKVAIALNAKSGSNATGNIVFKEENGKVHMTAIMSGLEPGSHAIHIHQTSDCSSTDGKSAGGHWNPTNQPHGKWGATEGYHKGDIGNFIADEKGNGTISFSTDEWCIGCDDDNKNILGKGVIVHAGTDDYGQPTGNAGGRVSCGGIIE
jgi:Cu-Zn family superoxide dismutase